jgi:DNA-binding transcriptional regulator YiaG
LTQYSFAQQIGTRERHGQRWEKREIIITGGVMLNIVALAPTRPFQGRSG